METDTSDISDETLLNNSYNEKCYNTNTPRPDDCPAGNQSRIGGECKCTGDGMDRGSPQGVSQTPPTCTSDNCLEGYNWDSPSNTCVFCADQSTERSEQGYLLNKVNCLYSTPGTCVDDAAYNRCGQCKTGYVDNSGDGMCSSCAEGYDSEDTVNPTVCTQCTITPGCTIRGTGSRCRDDSGELECTECDSGYQLINKTCRGKVNCVGAWSDWTACTGTCYPGESSSRTYTITSQASYGGDPCGEDNNNIETRPCCPPSDDSWAADSSSPAGEHYSGFHR